MTQQLYLADAWTRDFTARVTAHRVEGDKTWLSLDRSAFYPEGGGQPGDSGRLLAGDQVWQVQDTQKDAQGQVWHAVTGPDTPPPAGSQVRGELDWARRFDHMQQHTGEHLIASCLYRLTGGFTHGLHIGREVSTIDVTMPDNSTRLGQDVLDDIEALANRLITEDSPVTCRFPDAAELAGLPLRKDPTVQEQVRVCAMGDYEMVACGGTHLSRTGQIGLVKLLGSEPARGKLRLSFLCGGRAVAHYVRVYKAVTRAGELLSAGVDELPGRLSEALRQAEDNRRELGALRRQRSLAKLPGLLEQARVLPDGRRLVIAQLEEQDLPALEALAGEMVKHSGLIALLCVPRAGRFNLLFARSPDVKADMAEFIRSTGAKGGGRSDFARGAAADSLPWEAAQVMAPHLP